MGSVNWVKFTEEQRQQQQQQQTQWGRRTNQSIISTRANAELIDRVLHPVLWLWYYLATIPIQYDCQRCTQNGYDDAHIWGGCHPDWWVFGVIELFCDRQRREWVHCTRCLNEIWCFYFRWLTIIYYIPYLNASTTVLMIQPADHLHIIHELDYNWLIVSR